MRRALVTGSRGFLGRHVVAELGACGVEVTALTRNPGPDERYVAMGEIPWPEKTLACAIRKADPDVIFHLIGSGAGSERLLRARNVDSARSIMRVVQENGLKPKLVFCGSAAEYGASIRDGEPVTEDTVCRPIGVYGAMKLAQTEAALRFATATGTAVLVARIFNPIGPGMPPHLAIGEFARQIAAIPGSAGVLNAGNLGTYRDFLDVRDAVAAMVRLARDPSAVGVVNICRGEAISLRSLVDRLIAASGKEITLKTVWDRVRPQDQPIVVGSTKRLAAFGAAPPPTDFPRVIGEIWDDARLRARGPS